jgi:methionyl aminopeptidase
MITIKSAKEIGALKVGGKHHKAVIEALVELAKPGVSTQILENKTREMIAEFGDTSSFLNFTPYGAKRAYPAALCLSINDEIVHGIPNENPRILKDGDVIKIDTGLVHDEMYVDGAVTIIVGGKGDAKAKELVKATREALQAGIDQARVGNTIGHIGNAISKVADAYGFEIADDLCGHGVGHGVHEEPYVPNFGKPGEGPKLKAGMVLAIEPMLTLGTSKVKLDKDGYTYRTADGSLSAQFEHTVVITDGDPIVVTK